MHIHTIHTYIQHNTYIHTYIHTYIYIYTRPSIHPHIHTYIQLNMKQKVVYFYESSPVIVCTPYRRTIQNEMKRIAPIVLFVKERIFGLGLGFGFRLLVSYS